MVWVAGLVLQLNEDILVLFVFVAGHYRPFGQFFGFKLEFLFDLLVVNWLCSFAISVQWYLLTSLLIKINNALAAGSKWIILAKFINGFLHGLVLVIISILMLTATLLVIILYIAGVAHLTCLPEHVILTLVMQCIIVLWLEATLFIRIFHHIGVQIVCRLASYSVQWFLAIRSAH